MGARLLYTTVSMSHAEKHGRSSHTAHRTSRVQRRSHAATRCLNTRAFERFVADSHLAFQSRVLTSLPDVFNAPDSLVDPNLAAHPPLVKSFRGSLELTERRSVKSVAMWFPVKLPTCQQSELQDPFAARRYHLVSGHPDNPRRLRPHAQL